MRKLEVFLNPPYDDIQKAIGKDKKPDLGNFDYYIATFDDFFSMMTVSKKLETREAIGIISRGIAELVRKSEEKKRSVWQRIANVFTRIVPLNSAEQRRLHTCQLIAAFDPAYLEKGKLYKLTVLFRGII